MSSSTRDKSCQFSSTRWSVVMLAGHAGDTELGRAALETILRRYLPALAAYLTRNNGLTRDAADELVQGFVTDTIVQGNLIAKADQRRGRFRALLITALVRYVASQERRRMADKRSPERGVSLAHLSQEPDHEDTPPAAFDLAWAREVIAQTLERMESRCRADGELARWTIFEARVVGPTLHQAKPPPYEELVAKLGLTSPLQASNTLATAKRMFERFLRDAVAQYTPDEEVDDEIKHIRAILARGGAS